MRLPNPFLKGAGDWAAAGLMIQVSQVMVHPDGMLLSLGFIFTERASRWDALSQHQTNPVGIRYR